MQLTLPTITLVTPTPHTRLHTRTAQHIRALLRTVNTRAFSSQARVAAAVTVFDAVRASGTTLIRELTFANVVFGKCFEMRCDPAFDGLIGYDTCFLELSPTEWFDAIAAWVLQTAGLKRLISSRQDNILSFSILQEVLTGLKFAVPDPLSIAEGLAQHRTKYRVVMSQLRFTQTSLEYLAYQAVVSLPIAPRPREVGHRCCVAWAEDNQYHPAKIVWISQSRRLCKFVYAGWVSGWETEQHSVLLSRVVDYDRLGE
jgi:hypothetical protein